MVCRKRMIFRGKQGKPTIIKMSVDEKEQLLIRIQDSSLGAEDKHVVSGVIENHHWLFDVYERGKLTMHKLQTLLFGKKTEKQRVLSVSMRDYGVIIYLHCTCFKSTGTRHAYPRNNTRRSRPTVRSLAST